MESPISICDTEIPLQMQSIDAFTASYVKSLHSLRATAQETARCQGTLLQYNRLGFRLQTLYTSLLSSYHSLSFFLSSSTRRG